MNETNFYFYVHFTVVIGTGKAAHGGLKFVLKAQSQPDGNQQVEAPLEEATEQITVLKTPPSKGNSATASEKTKKVEVSPGTNSEASGVAGEISPNESKSEHSGGRKAKSTTPKAKTLKNGVPAKRVSFRFSYIQNFSYGVFLREDRERFKTWKLMLLLKKMFRSHQINKLKVALQLLKKTKMNPRRKSENIDQKVGATNQPKNRKRPTTK